MINELTFLLFHTFDFAIVKQELCFWFMPELAAIQKMNSIASCLVNLDFAHIDKLTFSLKTGDRIAAGANMHMPLQNEHMVIGSRQPVFIPKFDIIPVAIPICPGDFGGFVYGCLKDRACTCRGGNQEDKEVLFHGYLFFGRLLLYL